ncbi:MAG TPA: PDZ domain-containing protein [Actinomycetota bacterium]|nr:PDZ domain-containing protein [Actinomycetota bacterium]
MASANDPPNDGPPPDPSPDDVLTEQPAGQTRPDRPAPRGLRRVLTWAPAWLLILALIVAVVGPAGYFIHLPYYSVGPGPAVDVLTAIDARGGARIYRSAGKLLLTTVSESVDTVNVWDAFVAWVDPNVTLISEQAVLGGQTSQEVDIENQLEMDDSKYNAEIAAFRALGLKVPRVPGARVLSVVDGLPAFGKLRAQDLIVSVDGTAVTDPQSAVEALQKRKIGETVTIGFKRGRSTHSITLKTVASPPVPGEKSHAIVGVNLEPAFQLPRDIQIDTQNIVGPSAGMMIALAIYDALTPADLTGGHIIAGTGTIAVLWSGQAVIGDIGGIEEKVRAAASNHADIFIAPFDQAAAARKVAPKSMRVVGVKTFADALKFLKSLAPVRKAS